MDSQYAKVPGATLGVDTLLRTNPLSQALIKDTEQGPSICVGGLLGGNLCHLPAAALFNHLWRTDCRKKAKTTVTFISASVSFFRNKVHPD